MKPSAEIRVPREIVNDDFVTIVSWQKSEGAKVHPKETVVHIETSKAVLEVEVEVEGYLEILHPGGAEVAIGELIGTIHAEPFVSKAVESSTVPGDSAGITVSRTSDRTASSEGIRISKKAQILIEKYSIDPSVFSDQSLIREADIIQYLEQQEVKSDAADTILTTTERVIDHAKEKREDSSEQRGGLWYDLRVSAGERDRGLIWLFLNYFWRNWLLGNLVRWAPRGAILILHRLRGVKMGSGCFIDPTAIIETAYPENITIGNDVRITAGAIIMTHIKPPHYLRETGIMPAVIKPVVLEDYCFIGVNVVIMPGLKIGKAAVVASGSVVVNNVPSYSMVAGNPAKVIKRFPKPDEEI